MKLFRPVGVKELLKIIDLNLKRFPSRLPQQSIFYLVLNMDYAEEIASKWNIKDPVSDDAGYILEFKVQDAYITKYKIERAGNKNYKELWVPAEEL